MKLSSDFPANIRLADALRKREEQNALRRLKAPAGLIDFCSNDYLGFARSVELSAASLRHEQDLNLPNGSGGSRLLTGNSALAEELENEIAAFHGAEAGLIYNSGYDANLGLFSSLGQKEDTIIYDELIHASVHDGIRLSKASAFAFRHNDLAHLEERLRSATGTVYVAVESIYSMDGDSAPLLELAALCKKHDANLVVDEAHATGISGNAGQGLVQSETLEKEVFARVHTFGKALGCHGAIVLGSRLLRDYQVNFSRSFIYTTALPPRSLLLIREAYRLLSHSQERIEGLNSLISRFREAIGGDRGLMESFSPIQCIIISGNTRVKQVAEQLQSSGFDVRPILSPTVPKGKERLRICLHSFNSAEEVERLTTAINSCLSTNNG